MIIEILNCLGGATIAAALLALACAFFYFIRNTPGPGGKR